MPFHPKIHVVIEGAEFADYFWPAVEQYVECTHEYWRSNGKFVPILYYVWPQVDILVVDFIIPQNIEGALATLPGPGLFALLLPMMRLGCFVLRCALVGLLYILNRRPCIISRGFFRSTRRF